MCNLLYVIVQIEECMCVYYGKTLVWCMSHLAAASQEFAACLMKERMRLHLCRQIFGDRKFSIQTSWYDERKLLNWASSSNDGRYGCASYMFWHVYVNDFSLDIEQECQLETYGLMSLPLLRTCFVPLLVWLNRPWIISHVWLGLLGENSRYNLQVYKNCLFTSTRAI